MSLKEYLAEVSVPVYFVVMFFAISAWIDINGLYVEVPLFVNVLPEGWNLFSYITVIIQVANIGPIIYTILKKAFPARVKEWPVVYIIIGIGASACMLLAFFWQETTTINGELHSTALFALTGFLALVDCTSSVVYLPYMGQFKPQYMTAYYIGEGLSGMLPGLVGLIQGVESEPDCINQTVIVTNETTGENTTEYNIVAEYPPPLFSVQVFFFFLFGMMVVSGTSFTILHFHPFCQKEHVTSSYSYKITDEAEKDINIDTKLDTFYTNSAYPEKTDKYNALGFDNAISSEIILTTKDRSSESTSRVLTTGQFVYLLVLTGWLNALLNGVIPSTQSYTCLPYGSLAFTLAVRLSTVANPLMCLVALFFGTKSLVAVGSLSLVATGLTGWHLYLAAMSPYPPLKGTDAGTALVIVTQIVCTGCIAYVKVSNATIFNEHGGARALLWCGGVTQIGSFIGAVVTFIFVTVLEVFESEPACPGMTW